MAREDDILEELKKLNKSVGGIKGGGGGGGASFGGGGGGNTGGISAVNAALDATSKNLQPFGQALKQGGEIAGSALKTLKETVDNNLGVWRDLSKVGANFSNDLFSMNIAAAQARLPLQEFAGVIKDNITQFAGLGIGVTRGSEAFGKLMGAFQDSGYADTLKNLGYSNKELADVMASQVRHLRFMQDNDKARNEVAITSATALAEEMDKMAKLTGKSREKQLEELKAVETDMQYQAAIRKKALEIEDPKKRAEFLAQQDAMMKQANEMGMGQLYKERVAFGQAINQTTSMQEALLPQAAKGIADAANLARNTAMDNEQRRAAQNEAFDRTRAANAAAQNDKSILDLRMLGENGGKAAAILNENALKNKDMNAVLDQVAATHNLNLANENDRRRAMELANEEVKKSASGQNAAGKQVDGATKAAVALGSTLDSVRAGLTKGLLEPVRDQIQKPLETFGQNLKTANMNFQGSGKPTSQYIEDKLKSGASGSKDPRTKGEDGILGTAIEDVGKLASTGGKALGTGVSKINEAMAPTPKPQLAGGTLGTFGKMFENWGAGTDVTLHGMEAVLRPEDLKKIVGSSISGLGQSMPGLASGGGIGGALGKEQLLYGSALSKDAAIDSQGIADKMNKEMMMYGQTISKQSAMSAVGQGMPGFDLGNISKNINTSLSGLSSSIKMPDVKDFTSPFENTFKSFTSSFKSLTKTTAKKVEESYDEFKGLDEAIAKQMPFDEFGGLDEAIAKQIPFDEFAGLDEAIAKQIPFDEFAGLDDFIAKQIPFDEFAGLDEAIKKQAAEDTEFGDLEGAMAKVSQDVSDEFGDLAGAMKSAAERMYPDTEFGDLEGAMAKVASDVDTEFGDLAGAMKRAAEDMYPDTEFGDLEGAMAKVNHDIDTEFGDLDGAMKYAQSQPYDEFGDLEGAMKANGPSFDSEWGDLEGAMKANGPMEDLFKSTSPSAAQAPGRPAISMGSFTLGKNGLPIPKPKSTAAAVPEKPAAKQAGPGKAINPETGEEYTPVDSAAGAPGAKGDSGKPSDEKTAPAGKSATLDDVVKKLESLNTNVGRLISTNEQGYAAIARSAKSTSNNLYERAKA